MTGEISTKFSIYTSAKLHGSGLLFGGLRMRLVDMLDREVYVLKDTTVPKMIVLYQHY